MAVQWRTVVKGRTDGVQRNRREPTGLLRSCGGTRRPQPACLGGRGTERPLSQVEDTGVTPRPSGGQWGGLCGRGLRLTQTAGPGAAVARSSGVLTTSYCCPLLPTAAQCAATSEGVCPSWSPRAICRIWEKPGGSQLRAVLRPTFRASENVMRD